MQLQGELQAKNSMKMLYPNALSGFGKILKNEGLQGLQRGLLTAYAYQIVLNGTRLGLYDSVKARYQRLLDAVSGKERYLPAVSMLAGGATTGVLGAFLASPLFLIKTRIQALTTSKLVVGHQHTYLNEGILKSVSHIYRTEGLRGLWRGADASMLRTGIGSAVQLSSYDLCKSYIQTLDVFDQSTSKGQLHLHFSASAFTSLLVCVAMNPFDVASTRMYNQASASDLKSGALYKNGLDCLKKVVRTEGLSALYKGFVAHYLRIGPHTILTFVFLEQVKAIPFFTK